MLALGLTCFVTSALSGETQIWYLSFLLLLLNLFSSVQDIAVDSLAVTILDPNELGAGNTVQVVAYKAGSMFAGGLLLIVREAFGWQVMFLAFGSIYLIAIALTSQFDMVEDKEHHKDERSSHSQSFRHILKVDGTAWMIAFVLFYKLCERAEQTFALYLVDKKVPREELAVLSTFIRAFSILGSTASGIALTRRYLSSRSLVALFSISRAVTIAGLSCVVLSWGLEPTDFANQSDHFYKYVGFLFICLTSIGAGGITTATFTMMMQLSQKAGMQIQGTHYSLLATSEVLGKLIFAAVAGWLSDLVGLQIMFVSFTVLACIVFPFIQSAPKSVTNFKDVR